MHSEWTEYLHLTRFLTRVEALKQWRKLKAQELKVESDIILPRDLLHALAARNPQDMSALSECLSDIPWRRERYEEDIMKALAKVKGRTLAFTR